MNCSAFVNLNGRLFTSQFVWALLRSVLFSNSSSFLVAANLPDSLKFLFSVWVFQTILDFSFIWLSSLLPVLLMLVLILFDAESPSCLSWSVSIVGSSSQAIHVLSMFGSNDFDVSNPYLHMSLPYLVLDQRCVRHFHVPVLVVLYFPLTLTRSHIHFFPDMFSLLVLLSQLYMFYQHWIMQ